MMRLGILGSTRGSNLLPLTQAIKQNHLPATIQIVISNKSDALILSRAKEQGLNTEFVDSKNLIREAYDEIISDLLQKHKVDLIVLIGYMRILSAPFVANWENKIINIHPSLLPAFAGKMDLAVHQAVINAGCKETGCTVHYVTQEVDAGPIILQETCPVFSNDTAQSLKERVQTLEGQALIEAITKMVALMECNDIKVFSLKQDSEENQDQ